jgi:hypothetical protein
MPHRLSPHQRWILRGLGGLGLLTAICIASSLAYPRAAPTVAIPDPPSVPLVSDVKLGASVPVAPSSTSIDVGPPLPFDPLPTEPTVVAAPTPIPDPAPVAGPVEVSPSTPQAVSKPDLSYLILPDGRRFIGVHHAALGVIDVEASIRGGVVTRMPSLRIHVDIGSRVETTPYDGAMGRFDGRYVPPAPDPLKAAAVAQARTVAAEREQQKRAEAAERERIQRQEVARLVVRQETGRRVAAATEQVRMAKQREQLLSQNATALDADRRIKLELINGLQLQLNTAMDRWNQDVQTRGKRVVNPDGTITGGPTPATEALVNNLQVQMLQARATRSPESNGSSAPKETNSRLWPPRFQV